MPSAFLRVRAQPVALHAGVGHVGAAERGRDPHATRAVGAHDGRPAAEFFSPDRRPATAPMAQEAVRRRHPQGRVRAEREASRTMVSGL